MSNKFVVDAEAEVGAEVQTLIVTDEVKVVSVEVKAAPTPTAPAPPDEFWIVLSAVSALLTLLVAV
jgi:hypothetical protein